MNIEDLFQAISQMTSADGSPFSYDETNERDVMLMALAEKIAEWTESAPIVSHASAASAASAASPADESTLHTEADPPSAPVKLPDFTRNEVIDEFLKDYLN